MTTALILALLCLLPLILVAGITSQNVSINYTRLSSRAGPAWLKTAGVIDNIAGPFTVWREVWKRIKSAGYAGGYKQYYTVDLAMGGGEGSYGGTDTLDVEPVESETVGQVGFAQYARPITVSFEERDIVRGNLALVASSVKRSTEKAMSRIMDDLNRHLQSDDGTGNSSKRLQGFKLWVAKDPTASGATPGGISQNGNAAYRNQILNLTTTAANFLPKLRTLTTTCKLGTKGPKLVVCNRTFRDTLEGKMADTFYHNPVIGAGGAGGPMSGKSGDPAIGVLFYRGMPVFEDPDWALYAADAASEEAVLFDPDSFYKVQASSKADIQGTFEYVPLERAPQQTANVGFIRFHGQVFCGERRTNGLAWVAA